MPEIESYLFTHRELLELLVKDAGVKEGRWQMQVQFNFTAGNFGPDESNVLPGAVIAVQQIGLVRAKADSPRGLTVDAAEIER